MVQPNAYLKCESYFAGEVLIWRLMFGLNGSSLINSEVFQSFNIFFLLINGLESFPIKITKSPKNIFHGVVFQPNYIKLLHSVDMYSTNSMNCKRKDMYIVPDVLCLLFYCILYLIWVRIIHILCRRVGFISSCDTLWLKLMKCPMDYTCTVHYINHKMVAKITKKMKGK